MHWCREWESRSSLGSAFPTLWLERSCASPNRPVFVQVDLHACFDQRSPVVYSAFTGSFIDVSFQVIQLKVEPNRQAPVSIYGEAEMEHVQEMGGTSSQLYSNRTSAVSNDRSIALHRLPSHHLTISPHTISPHLTSHYLTSHHITIKIHKNFTYEKVLLKLRISVSTRPIQGGFSH
jgi:hypothetical protein